MKVACHEKIRDLEEQLAQERTRGAADRRASERIIAGLQERVSALVVEVDDLRGQHVSQLPPDGRQEFRAASEVVCACPPPSG